MHILFVAGWWPTEASPLNGIFIKEHAEAVSKTAKVTVLYLNSVTQSIWNRFPYTVQEKREQLNSNLEVITLDLSLTVRRFGLLDRAISHLSFKLISKVHAQKPVDVLHIHVLTKWMASSILSNSKKFKLPIVLTEHTSFYHTEIYQLPVNEIEKEKRLLQRLLNTEALRYILPVSKQLGNVLVNDYHAPAEKIKVIPNIANELFCRSSIEEKKVKEEILVFAAAIWQPPKNPMLFFEMLTLLKQRDPMTFKKIKIKWGGKGKLQDEVQVYIENNLQELDIHFMGLLTKAEIEYEMRQADFLVHPTNRENLPCIIIESLCTGLPVLSASVNGIVELLDESNGTMYTAGDIHDLYNRFNEMIKKRNTFDNKKIAQIARGKYNAEVVAKKITQVYSDIFN